MEKSNFRRLGATEKLFWLLDQTSQVHFVMAAEIQGKVDSQTISRALSTIQNRHPLLSSRIIDNGFEKPYFEYIPGAAIHLNIIEQNLEHTLEREMEKELSKPFLYSEAPLVRCTLISDPTRPVLLFSVHHAVSDGISMSIVIGDIVKVLNGEQVDPLALPPSVDQLLGLEDVDENSQPESVNTGNSPIHRRNEIVPQIVLKALPAKLSINMLVKSRIQQTSIQGILFAAAVCAARKSSLPWKLLPIKVIIPISIRKSITEGESSALYINSKAIVSEYTTDDDFWKIARSLKRELFGVKERETINRNAIEARKRLFGEKEISILSENLQNGVGRELMISNLGRISHAVDSGKITLERIWGPLALSGTQDEITIGVATVRNSLCISVGTRMPLTSFTDFFFAEIENACGT